MRFRTLNGRRPLAAFFQALALALPLSISGTSMLPALTGTEALRPHWRIAQASFYGEGFRGRPTACGGAFDPSEPVIASPSLPCGTEVMLCSRPDTCVRARVGDRGPYRRDALPRLVRHPWRDFDLSAGTCDRLRYRTDTPIAYCVIPEGGTRGCGAPPPWIESQIASQPPEEDGYRCDQRVARRE